MSTGDRGDPRRLAAAALNHRPLPKRFYKSVSVGVPEDRGVALLLDGRLARTPKKLELRVPTLEFARAIAGEWAAQAETIDPARMPLTRLANTALDGVTGREPEVRADIVRYAGTDLVCYRAEAPAGLVERQRRYWDPVLDDARERLGATFRTSAGIVHVAQPPEAVAAVALALGSLQAFPLTALHLMTTLTGSALIALGVLHGAWSVEDGWTAAHADEDWQVEQWGEDAEARARREARFAEMAAAARMLRHLAA